MQTTAFFGVKKGFRVDGVDGGMVLLTDVGGVSAEAFPGGRNFLPLPGTKTAMMPPGAGRCGVKGRRRRFSGSLVAVACLFALIQAGLPGSVRMAGQSEILD